MASRRSLLQRSTILQHQPLVSTGLGNSQVCHMAILEGEGLGKRDGFCGAGWQCDPTDRVWRFSLFPQEMLLGWVRIQAVVEDGGDGYLIVCLEGTLIRGLHHPVTASRRNTVLAVEACSSSTWPQRYSLTGAWTTIRAFLGTKGSSLGHSTPCSSMIRMMGF